MSERIDKEILGTKFTRLMIYLPSSTEIAILAPLAVVFLAFLLICGSYLLIRALKTRINQLVYMSLYFFFTAFYYILLLLATIGLYIPWAIRATGVSFASFCAILFIKEGFFQYRQLHFKFIIAFTIAVSLIYIGFAFLRDVADGTDLDLVVGRLGTTIASASLFILVSLWIVQLSFKHYFKYKKELVEQHVKIRYLLFGIAALFVLAIAVIDLIGTTASMYAGFDYDSIYIVLLLLVSVYTIIAYLTWVMPARFKQFLNRHAATVAATSKKDVLSTISTAGAADVQRVEKNLWDKIINQRGIMEIVSYLGDYLAKLIGKPPNATKGLFLISIQSQLGDEAIYMMTLDQVITVINGALKMRLGAMGIGNVDEVVKLLSEKIVNEQSILMMMAI